MHMTSVTQSLLVSSVIVTLCLQAQMTGPAFLTQHHPRCLPIDWVASPTHALAAWEQGKTGVPLVDASMRQLVATGWLHHILRHVVACFLTRGADTVVIVMALPC